MNPPQPRLNFFYDQKNDVLWIIHRKVGSSSLRKALGIHKMMQPEEAREYNQSRTIMPVRHPWERITSAINNVLGRFKCTFAERVQEEITSRDGPHAVDWHLWPQSYGAAGFRVDDLIPFKQLVERWDLLRAEYDLPPLPHINKSSPNHDWRRPEPECVPFDWNPLLPWYEDDFAYCNTWRKW